MLDKAIDNLKSDENYELYKQFGDIDVKEIFYEKRQ